MRREFSKFIESGRVQLDRTPRTFPGDLWGCFKLLCPITKQRLKIIVAPPDVSDQEMMEWGLSGEHFEHVSVSLGYRCPRWDEMCWVKDLFFEPEECVMQLHVPRSQHINDHPYCLHLWRPTKTPVPMPCAKTVSK